MLGCVNLPEMFFLPVLIMKTLMIPRMYMNTLTLSWFCFVPCYDFVCVRRLVLYVCVCLCVCDLVALLLNNPAYHVLLPDHRKGSRAVVVPRSAQAQEKSLNVPQGKKPQTGPAQSGGSPASHSLTDLSTLRQEKIFSQILTICFCMQPSHSLIHSSHNSFLCLKG